MEDSLSSFFMNGIKLQIESSFNKIKEINSIIFKEDFEEIFINNIFINNINLFRDIIAQNNLHVPSFWNHIGKLMKSSIENCLAKYEEELKEEKKSNIEESKSKIDLGEINLLKLKLMNISFYLITTVDSEDFLKVKSEQKDKLNQLINSFIKINQEKNEDFSEFIKNYIIKIALLINENSRIINSGFLKYLSYDFYELMQSTTNSEQIKHLKIYIDQVINNPKLELNKYINFGALNKKIIKKEKISRSRGASFDIRDPTLNNNNNIEKNNKKISDFFKKDKTITSMNKTSSKNNEENKENDIKSKISSYSFGGKNLAFPSGTELNLVNFGSGISNISNFSFANNGGGSNKISLDDSLNLSGLFPKPSSEIEKTNKFKNLFFKCPVIPAVVKNKQFKRKKLLDRLKKKESLDIRKFINKKRKNENKENEKEMKEFREVVNSSFYGNENENIDNIINIDEENNFKIKEINIKKDDLNKENKDNNKKDENILMFKTPNKDDKSNIENMDENILKNFDMDGIQKNLNFLFEQKSYL